MHEGWFASRRVRGKCCARRRTAYLGDLAQCPVMRIGMTLPVMEPGLDAETLETWSRAIDEGPFVSLCFGERMAFDNPDSLTLLGAVSAWTKRVRIVTTVVVPQLHEPVPLAKALATGDGATAGFAGTPAQLKDLLARLADLGTDEFHFVPTGKDVSQVHRVAELVG